MTYSSSDIIDWLRSLHLTSEAEVRDAAVQLIQDLIRREKQHADDMKGMCEHLKAARALSRLLGKNQTKDLEIVINALEHARFIRI